MKKYITARKRNTVPVIILGTILTILLALSYEKTLNYFDLLETVFLLIAFFFLYYLSELGTFILIEKEMLIIKKVLSRKVLKITEIKKIYLHARLTNDLRFYYKENNKTKYISFNINQYKKETVVELLNDIKKINPSIEDLDFTREVIDQNKLYS